MLTKTVDNTEIMFDDKPHHFKYYDPYSVENMRSILPVLGDLKKNGRNDGLVKGVVRTFNNGKIIDHGTTNIVDKFGSPVKTANNAVMENVVVAKGRTYVAQRLFASRHSSDPEVFDWEITHFGLGKGGAVTVDSYVTLLGPEICDQDLYDPLPLTGDPVDPLYLTSPGDNVRNVDATPYAVKPIDPSGMIDIIATTDIECDFGVTYSYVRCVCVKSISEPNYLEEDDDYLLINECCLYYSDGTDTYAFAHICFPPKYVEKKSEFVVEWYILC